MFEINSVWWCGPELGLLDDCKWPIVGFENILHNLIPAVLQLVKADNILIVAINVE